jgi:hypothetical protein
VRSGRHLTHEPPPRPQVQPKPSRPDTQTVLKCSKAEMLTSASRMLRRTETYCLYNIEYRRGISQIHHQAAPSRAQAARAAVIGGT